MLPNPCIKLVEFWSPQYRMVGTTGLPFSSSLHQYTSPLSNHGLFFSAPAGTNPFFPAFYFMSKPELQKSKYVLYSKMKVEFHRSGANPLGGQTSIHCLSSSLVIRLQFCIIVHLFPHKTQEKWTLSSNSRSVFQFTQGNHWIFFS